jgi:hypothetical protein
MSSSAAAATAIKQMKVVSNLAGNSADYSPFAREFMEKHPSAGLSAAVHAINCHTADMFLLFLSIIADKYGHSVDDLVATIKTDERWNEAQTHPLVKSLTYFEQADADAVTEASKPPLSRKTAAEVPTETLQEELKAPKKAKAAPKPKTKIISAVAEAAGVEESVVAAAAADVPCMADACTTEVEVKPAKKAPAKKATAKAAAEEAPVAAAEDAVSEEKPKKKAPSKKADAAAEPAAEPAAEEAVSEEKPKKKAPAKKATTGDSAKKATAAVEELATSMASLTVDEAKPAAAAAPKKTIARKPTAAAKA